MTTMAPTLTRYRIAVRGRLSRRLSSAFEGMALEDGPHGSVLVGDLLDQGQLYGMLDRLRDFGIELLGVEQAPGLAEDWSLLASAREGDSRAFAALVARHHGTVARVASSVVPDPAAARELAARTWANALDARGAVRDPGRLDRWLVTLLLTLAAQPAAGATAAGERGIDLGCCLGDRLARDGVRAGSRALVDPGSGVPSSLRRAIGGLPPGPRLVLALHDVEGWSVAEIADELGVADRTVRNLLNHARRRLIQALEQDTPAGGSTHPDPATP
jgi:DNA-directed RNA polymerase specialized sigma24 family protein